jgi:hypothetical protein
MQCIDSKNLPSLRVKLICKLVASIRDYRRLSDANEDSRREGEKEG